MELAQPESKQIVLSTDKALELLAHKVDELYAQSPRPIVIAIAGATAAGKSTFIEGFETISAQIVSRLSLDSFYRGRSYNERHDINFDVPEAVALDEAAAVIREFLYVGGSGLRIPAYSFETAERDQWQYVDFTGTEILLIDGLFSMTSPLDRLSQLKVYIDADVIERGLRRVIRDAGSRPLIPPRQNLAYFTDILQLQAEHVKSARGQADIVVDTTSCRAWDQVRALAVQAMEASLSYANSDQHLREQDIETFLKKVLTATA